MTPRILLLGANGQLGHVLSTELLAVGQVRALTRQQADLAKPERLRAALDQVAEVFQPSVIVNAAAYTAVDKAETERDLAILINATSVQVIAAFAQEMNASLMHFSTDYVFDGTDEKPWQETDETAPLSVYGKSKLLGEQTAVNGCDKHLVLRTSWVVGVHGANFLRTMLKLAAERDTLRVVADQVGAPTSTALLSQVAVQLISTMKNAATNDAGWGTYHVAAAGETSWHGYAQYVIDGATKRGAKLKADVSGVQPIRTEEYPLPAPRPLNSRLNTQKICRQFGVHLPHWQDGIDAILDELFQPKTYTANT